MELRPSRYGLSGELSSNFDHGLQRTKEVLTRHGFGVQAEIAISEALKSKLGVTVPREVILGVCNPSLAHRAIQAEPEITLLLPCNVIIREIVGGVHIAVADPEMLVTLTGNTKLTAVASEAKRTLAAALHEL